MKTPFILFLGLALGTAAIAYTSDNLGKKLGKKRVSLFGWRPRTTATLLTVGSSWLIMAVTWIVLLSVWAPLRNALTSYDTVVQETNQLRQASGDLSKRVAAAEAELRQRNTEIERGERKLDDTRHKLDVYTHKLERANTNLTKAQRSEAQARQGQIQSERRTSEALARQVLAQNRLKGAEQDYRNARARLTETQDRLRQVNGRLRLVMARLTQEQARYVSSVKENLREIEALRTERTQLEGKVKELRESTEYFSLRADEYLQRAQFFGAAPPRLVVDQVLADRTMPGRTSQEEARRVLQELLAEGQSVMPPYYVKVAGSTNTVTQQAKLKLFRYVWPLGPDAAPLSQEASLSLLVQVITSSAEGVSLRLISARNYFEGEREIEARFIVVPIKPAFKAGEVIVEDRIDGMGDDAVIFKALLNLIEKGREAASERRVNPPLSPRQPDYYAADTKQRLFEALRRLEALKRPANVRIVAADEQNTVEPLRIRFEVE